MSVPISPLRRLVRDSAQTTTLARVFKDAGYQTAAFVGAYVLDRRFGLAEGFDTYDDRILRNPEGPTKLESERRANEVVAAATTWLDRADASKPAFIWIHLYDPHAPYEPPAQYLKQAAGRPYEGEVMFADAQAGAIEETVRKKFGASLYIAVAGDHGEGLGDHGEATHGMLAYDSTLRVPVVLAGPGISQGKREGTLGTLRDLGPTLLAAAKLNVPSKMTGHDLLGQRQPKICPARAHRGDDAGIGRRQVLATDQDVLREIGLYTGGFLRPRNPHVTGSVPFA